LDTEGTESELKRLFHLNVEAEVDDLYRLDNSINSFNGNRPQPNSKTIKIDFETTDTRAPLQAKAQDKNLQEHTRLSA
jgi:hypothetical protein